MAGKQRSGDTWDPASRSRGSKPRTCTRCSIPVTNAKEGLVFRGTVSAPGTDLPLIGSRARVGETVLCWECFRGIAPDPKLACMAAAREAGERLTQNLRREVQGQLNDLATVRHTPQIELRPTPASNPERPR